MAGIWGSGVAGFLALQFFEETSILKVLTLFNPGGVVQPQQLGGSAASGGEAFNTVFKNLKMILPPVATWMKKRHDLPSEGINRGDITSLEPIAQGAREAQIVGFGFTSMLFGDEMVEFMSGKCGGLGDQAILATVVGTLTNKAA